MTADNGKIPFLDLVSPHKELEDELVEIFREALESGRFIGGPMVERFEQDFAAYCDTGYCIGAGSGTDALRFALVAAGVNAGDTVITVPNTFIATTEAISQAGATVEFVDIDTRTYNLDPGKLKEHLETQCHRDHRTGKPVSRRTKGPVSAIVPVHLYGQMADMDQITEIAEEYGLLVIEDACQAHGAEYFSQKKGRWRKAGSVGKAGAFSFYPGKNLGACGEGGAITTNDEEVARKARMLRDHGQVKKYLHEMEGYNGRLDAIQAGILYIKLRHLPRWNESRRQRAYCYNELLALAEEIAIPYTPSWVKHVYHLYVVRTRMREELRGHLAKHDIDTGLHYPVPLHLQKAYAPLGYRKGDFPVSERLASEILSLPMFPGLRGDQQERVAARIDAFTSSCPPRSRRKALLV
ncbi:MAG TPA: DegT/DnrJ/EryC1/StrS family aminotransferase [Dissulfurispiraceae bacterium]